MDRPEWRIGDTWTYQVKSVETGKTSTLKRTVVREENDTYVVRSGSKEDFHNKQSLNLREARDLSGKILWSYVPDLPLFDWPLKVGKLWRTRFTSTDPQGERMTVDVTVEVKALEEVDLLFSKKTAAFKLVEQRYNMRGAQVGEYVWWVSPEMKNIVRWIESRILLNKTTEGWLIDYKTVKD
jgi:hypothetical protein